MKELGSGRPASGEVSRLYRQAFDRFGARCLWSRRPSEWPTLAQALTVVDALRFEGNNAARSLAAEIEEACRVPNPVFGFMLHVVDIATDTAIAAAGRREPRDVLDLLYIDEAHLPLGAVIWAAVGKDAGFCPESLIAEIRRNARYRADDCLDLGLVEPVDAGLAARRFRDRLNAAETFSRAMPAGKEDLLFLEEDRPVQPDPAMLAGFTERGGRRRGHWPTSPGIGSAMLEARRP